MIPDLYLAPSKSLQKEPLSGLTLNKNRHSNQMDNGVISNTENRLPTTGSADPYLLLMDPDPTPFFSDLKDANK